MRSSSSHTEHSKYFIAVIQLLCIASSSVYKVLDDLNNITTKYSWVTYETHITTKIININGNRLLR